MKKFIHHAGVLVFLLVQIFTSHAQQITHSVLSTGHWAKFQVSTSGVYKIDYNMLKAAGFDPGQIDPARLTMFSMPTGMLPQANAAPRTEDLKMMAITVLGEEDGRFDNGDLIIFYGQSPNTYTYMPDKEVFAYTKNLYSDKNFYFLTLAPQNGLRIQPSNHNGTGLPVINEFIDFSVYENDLYNELKSGREWYGEQFDARTEITIRFGIPGIVENSPIRVVSNVMAQSYTESSFKLFWNGTQIMDRAMGTIFESQYATKGKIGRDTLLTSAAVVGASIGINQDLRYQFIKASSGRSVGYLDNITVHVWRQLARYNNGAATFFTIPPAAQPDSELEIANMTDAVTVWDVTDPFKVIRQKVTVTNNAGKFTATTSTARNYIAHLPAEMQLPVLEGVIENQDLHGMITPDLLIVTHPDFLTEARRLAAHRSTVYGLDVQVATTTEIFNEFSAGRPDVTAIRDFTRQLFMKTPGKLKNLLLFGRCSYDYKNRVFNNSNYVPTYQSRNSLGPLETFSSDDFFALMDEDEGEWLENSGTHEDMDIGVGRIPVRNVNDASMVVEKLITFDNHPDRFGAWRQEILFVADDGDYNIHQGDADELAEDMEIAQGPYATSKIYLDSYDQEDRPSGQISPQATEALRKAINKGYAIVNYTGHGSEQVWMQERILDINSPSEFTNLHRLPLFVTATCEFGRHDNPLLISTAENLLLSKKGGAIGLVTTARPVNSATNFSLNKAFYKSLLAVSEGSKDLGTIFKETKNQSIIGVANRNFSLLGDPSLRFGPSAEKVVITGIKTMNESDTLKALSMVAVEGNIQRGGIISEDFKGTIEIALFDKRSKLTTKGDENAPFTFYQWDHCLFRGKASVIDGEFRLEFLLPLNLVSAIGLGKVTAQAFTSDLTRETFGTFTGFKIGGLEPEPGNDNKGPVIELFMGDTTFVNGGYTNTDTRLVGILSDKSGINISGYDPATMTFTLDDDKTYSVSEYFVSSKDDFTTGMFTYPVYGLSEGHHTISFQAWDNYNNMGTAKIDFLVSEANKLVIEEFGNYPNPFTSTTTFQFTHSRSGEDLYAQLAIYDILGQLADVKEFTILSSPYRVTLFDWNGLSASGIKMNNGIYLARLSVRSLSDGAKNDKIAKLILVN